MKSASNKSVLSWALYDWANSAFATTIMAGFFPIFFKDYWNLGIDPSISTARLGFANSIASIIIALLAPILGAIADRGTARKRFLIFFSYLGVVTVGGLYFISQGQWVLAFVFYIISNIGFSGGNIFYDALLPAITSEEKIDVVSSFGYALGYLGGGILFAGNVWMVLDPTFWGLQNSIQAVQYSFITVGVWWGIFTIPLILFVQEPVYGEKIGGWKMVKAGFTQLGSTFQKVRHLKTIFLFLLAYWFYIDGVDTVIRMAVDYGKSIGFNTNDLITALLITQFVGFPSAIAFGYLAKKINPKPAILLGIGVYLFISIWGALMQNVNEFYALAIIVGLVQGGVQALSRSFYARLIPPDKTAEYFGFYNMLGKFAAVIGPALIGIIALLVHSMGYSSLFASRISIAAVSILFIIGGILLFYVDEKKGKEEVKYL